MSKSFYTLVDPSEIEVRLSRFVELKPLGVETVNIEDALNRVLAEDIYSPIDYPPFDRSVVDGYAVRSVDTVGADENNPVRLKYAGSIKPGRPPNIVVNEGCAVEVSTGSTLPRGADCVVMVEHTKVEGGFVFVYKPCIPGENVSTAGSDVSSGDLILLKGSLLSEKTIGVLAGLGIDRVKVYKKPRIAIYSVGEEIVNPNVHPLPLGMVYDVNGYLLASSLRKIGLDPVFRGVFKDDEESLIKALSKDLESFDIILSSGGTSKGVGDVVYRVMDKLGEPGVVIHGLKIKPGKPTVFSVVDGKLLIGLPGFPLSCFMVFNKLVLPLIAKIMGLKLDSRGVVKAEIPVRVRKPMGVTWFLPVSLISAGGKLVAYPSSFESGSISVLINSDGYCSLPPGVDVVYENTVVDVELFDEKLRFPDLVVIGSSDILLYEILVEADLAHRSRVIPLGSTAGWRAVERGEADVAPTHLLDPETLVFNKPFLDKFRLSDKATLIRGYSRLIGIIVAKGNPKGIRSVEDFLRDDVVIVNRTKGSGTWVYLEFLINRLASEKGMDPVELKNMIKGYGYEVKTHTAVALAVKQGRADAGLALGYVAKLFDLDFIPLTWEEFDFLVLKDRLRKPSVSKFIEVLRDRSFMERVLVKYRGFYSLHNDTGHLLN